MSCLVEMWFLVAQAGQAGLDLLHTDVSGCTQFADCRSSYLSTPESSTLSLISEL